VIFHFTAIRYFQCLRLIYMEIYLIKKAQKNIKNTDFLVYEKTGKTKQYYKLICD